MVQSHYIFVEQMNTFIHSIGSRCGFQDVDSLWHSYTCMYITAKKTI